jgi:hypothetical protein
MTMNRDTQRLLRILAVVAFVVALVFVWIGDGPAEHVEAVYTGLLGGLALFALSFATT